MATISQSPAKLELTSGRTQALQLVPRLEASTGYRTLGCFISGNGSMTKAKSVLRGHLESHAANILDANLRPDEAYTAYTMFFLPKIKFSLPVSIFTQEECRNIQAPALMQTLPLMRLNRHTARSIINGPNTSRVHKLQGVQRNFYVLFSYIGLKTILGGNLLCNLTVFS